MQPHLYIVFLRYVIATLTLDLNHNITLLENCYLVQEYLICALRIFRL